MESSAPPPITAEKRDMFYRLYAQALLYDRTPQKGQKELSQKLKVLSQRVTYSTDLITKVYHMTHDLVADWKKVSQATTKSWNEKSLDDRLAQLRDVVKLNDETHKRKYFNEVNSTNVSYMGPFWAEKATAAAIRLNNKDKFYVSHKYMCETEAHAAAMLVHEDLHLLILDHHTKQISQMREKGYSGQYADNVLCAKMFAKDKNLSYEDRLEFYVDHITEKLKTLPEEDFLSTAQSYILVTEKLSQQDRRFNWYSRCLEEALVRTCHAYAALLFNENADDTCRILKMCFASSNRDMRYTNYATSKQFARYTNEIDPKSSLTSLMMNLWS